MRRSGRSTWAVAALAIGLGCASAPAPKSGEVRFSPGEHVVRRGEVRVELIRVRYDDRGLELHVRLDNRGTVPVVVDRKGIVLAFDELEFPVADDPDLPVPARTEVPGDGGAEIRARFELGARATAETTLRLLSVKRGAQWVDDVALVIPGGIDPKREKKD